MQAESLEEVKASTRELTAVGFLLLSEAIKIETELSFKSGSDYCEITVKMAIDCLSDGTAVDFVGTMKSFNGQLFTPKDPHMICIVEGKITANTTINFVSNETYAQIREPKFVFLTQESDKLWPTLPLSNRAKPEAG